MASWAIGTDHIGREPLRQLHDAVIGPIAGGARRTSAKFITVAALPKDVLSRAAAAGTHSYIISVGKR